ncbi:MAG TPA: hypothetical protein VFA68_11310 [Terriglobales bacterium]|nr:hypothetical protein [Terriglobales bacterium]
MNLKFLRSRFLIWLVWLFVLIAAAIILPCVKWGESEPARVVLFVLTAGWLALTTTSLCVYFYRAWKRVGSVPNKVSYVSWLTFETACVLGIIGYLVASAALSDVTAAQRARERVLQQDLLVMRSLINQYTIDKQKPLRSLDELVEAGYLRNLPVDPTTGRNDTWVVVKCPDGKSEGGIVDVESGSGARSKRSSPCD